MINKSVLDEIIEKHKAQPVGHGYIDIIVSRDNYRNLIAEIVTNGFKIICISWWEWRQKGKGGKYGYGGPKSIFYKGWFSELASNVDDLNFPLGINEQDTINAIVSLIEAKVILYPNERVTFVDHDWLLPAIWLEVPNEWRNKYSSRLA